MAVSNRAAIPKAVMRADVARGTKRAEASWSLPVRMWKNVVRARGRGPLRTDRVSGPVMGSWKRG